MPDRSASPKTAIRERATPLSMSPTPPPSRSAASSTTSRLRRGRSGIRIFLTSSRVTSSLRARQSRPQLVEAAARKRVKGHAGIAAMRLAHHGAPNPQTSGVPDEPASPAHAKQSRQTGGQQESRAGFRHGRPQADGGVIINTHDREVRIRREEDVSKVYRRQGLIKL